MTYARGLRNCHDLSSPQARGNDLTDTTEIPPPTAIFDELFDELFGARPRCRVVSITRMCTMPVLTCTLAGSTVEQWLTNASVAGCKYAKVSSATQEWHVKEHGALIVA